MTGMTVSITADWALRGKTGTDRGYRLLDCSDGVISPRNFEEVLTRFSPGTLEVLPQVTASFLRSEQQHRNYLAIAIHQFAEGGRYDADGRKIVFTSYFCVPYSELAAEAISYQAMYEKFRAVQLPARSKSPISVEMEARHDRVPVRDELAWQVAALLLTGNPVCILDGDRLSVPDRLRFIDSVMSLLPYGMRSRMSASTWTSSTYQGHKFRLFFSNAPRETSDHDHIVIWGQPNRALLSPSHEYSLLYLTWLEDQIQQPLSRLAEQTDQLGFGQKDVLKMLELVGITYERPEPRPLPIPHPPKPLTIENLLVSCADQIAFGNIRSLKNTITELRNCATDPVALYEQHRIRYREIIARHRLLEPRLRMGRLEDSFYEVLLRVAFGLPLTYQGYCQIEDCLDNPATPPPRPLLEAISRGGFGEIQVPLIVLSYYDTGKLKQWLRSSQVDISQLFSMTGGEWYRSRHARIVCEVTIRLLRELSGRIDPRVIRPTMREHGFLALALERRYPGEPQYQMRVLTEFLRAAYGPNLNRHEAAEILAGNRTAPTAALLAAVMVMLADPADAKLAGRNFLRGILGTTGFDPATQRHLAFLMFDGDPEPGRLAIEPPKPAGENPEGIDQDHPTKKLGFVGRYKVHRSNRDGSV